MSEENSGGRIVVGVDASDSSMEALRWAVRQADLTGASVEATIAWHYPLLLGGYAWPPFGMLLTSFVTLAPIDFACATVACGSSTPTYGIQCGAAERPAGMPMMPPTGPLLAIISVYDESCSHGCDFHETTLG